ncbi:glycosyltransferase family protein [Natronorubrum texcoconense]|uniref:Nucleotide-diphospho-sugar transferase n=1 Tax=Natronorubrum texcoconense TaxID=1095776 RepID=A0A1G8VPV0_9EURY|nr:hypothetical protein [Natronorubrum texcoconense]SDJ68101.1 hypothetical protein SAMN04515672_1448 [Natronorubrum texcoconense]
MGSNRGVVYIATGEDYIKEAKNSARSIKSCMPDINISLFTDTDKDITHFDNIYSIENSRGDYGDSIVQPEMLCYDRTLFIDTDTYITENISDVFHLLDEFDVAAAHNPGSRTTPENQGYPDQNVPESFPLYNTGVLALKRNDAVCELLIDWESIYQEHISKSKSALNQPAFREALYHSDVHVATLPSEYNCRIRYSGSTGFLSSNAKIVHGRHPESLSKIADLLNSKSGMRVFSYKDYPLRLDTSSPSFRFYIRTVLTEGNEHYTYRGRFYNSLNERGTVDTIKRIVRDLKKSLFE